MWNGVLRGDLGCRANFIDDNENVIEIILSKTVRFGGCFHLFNRDDCGVLYYVDIV